MCSALPFGFAAAPIVFSKVMRALVKHFRSLGIRLFPFMDDLLFLERSFEKAEKLVKLVEKKLSDAGMLVNGEKSELIPV